MRRGSGNPTPLSDQPTVLVHVRVAWPEGEVRRQVKGAGGKWNPQQGVWELRYERVVALGLEERIVGDKESI